MNKVMDWLGNSFAPKMNTLCANPWISAISSALVKALPFILLGSCISLYNVVKSSISSLPDLGKVSDFSFGLLSIIIAFLVAYQVMDKKSREGYETTCGLVSISIFLMTIMPSFDETGSIIFNFTRFGASGMLMGFLAGIFTGVVFNLYAAWEPFKNVVKVPSFMIVWVNHLLPMFACVLIVSIAVFGYSFNIYDMINQVFMPIQSFGQTLPGFVLICFLPVFFYSLGISAWLLQPVTNTIMIMGMMANASGADPLNIVTFEVIFSAAFINMGGTGATLPLNILMIRSKFKKLRTIGKVTLIPSILNINEPVIFGAPVAFNPLLMVPMWITSIIGPIVVWFVMRGGLVNIPSQIMQIGNLPAPISSYLVTNDFRAIILFVGLFVIYYFIWKPFFLVYEKQCIEKENGEQTNESTK